jgi:peptide-methionine (S)-S-oxide reductase
MASPRLATLGLIALLALNSRSWGQAEGSDTTPTKDGAADTAAAKPVAKGKAKAPALEKATFGGGCFWCMEAVFERVPGVKSVVSGYAGGNTPRPTYEAVHADVTGHAEVIQITFDPEVISYDELLSVFWHSHDPTSLNRQGPDFGTQYRSIILYHSEAQKDAAIKSYRELTRSGEFGRPIVTDLVPMTKFWPAEKYHQDYYRRNRAAPYCQMNIDPKMVKLRYILQELRRSGRRRRRRRRRRSRRGRARRRRRSPRRLVEGRFSEDVAISLAPRTRGEDEATLFLGDANPLLFGRKDRSPGCLTQVLAGFGFRGEALRLGPSGEGLTMRMNPPAGGEG